MVKTKEDEAQDRRPGLINRINLVERKVDVEEAKLCPINKYTNIPLPQYQICSFLYFYTLYKQTFFFL